MSSITKFGLLSFVSTALAAPFYPSGYATGTGAPYGFQNTTGPYAPTGSGVSSSYTATETVYQTVELTAVEVSTIYQGASSALTVGAAEVSSASVCGPETITVTASSAVTVTVTPGSPAGYSSSVIAAAAVSSSSKAVIHQHGHHHSSKTSKVAAASSAAYTPPAYTAPAYTAPAPVSSYVPVSSVVEVSSVAAVVSTPAAYSSVEVPSSVVIPSSVAAPSSAIVSSAKASATSTPVKSGGGKRGIVYNLASLTTCFEGVSSITWGYNWGQTSDGLSSAFEYVPMLWGLRDDFLSTWETNWKAAIKAGTKTFLGFNEPDLPAQSNLTPAAAAEGWKTHMEPLKAADSSVRLGSPGVTNGADGMGIDWLVDFQAACSGCNIDFAVIHWYQAATDDMVAYFKKHVEEAHTRTGLNVWITEYAFTSGTDDEIASALKNVNEWMDSQDYVERYSYFMVGDGKLVTGTEKSTIGTAYAS